MHLSFTELLKEKSPWVRFTYSMLIRQVNQAGNELTIWDTRVSRFSVHEEFRNTFPSEDIIRDLDWTSTPDTQSILAVGFPRRVVLFCQQRYDYLNSGSTWIAFMSYDMHRFNLTSSIINRDTGLVTTGFRTRFGSIKEPLRLQRGHSCIYSTKA
jgi:RAVE protein 1 C terminal